ncbi:hypothetical protein XJ44_05305 [Thermosipho affectus]|uniref:DUF3352 domain-containing protein n=1 Tax=Thermosipho affectus TaxID=660294 RepID=A0ABX3IJ41_9BACT|nr:hypothetical protein [Thermosipho affectus]ONN27202.1 hypothetical protein XJ44_05305 [Thermosipho affectus]
MKKILVLVGVLFVFLAFSNIFQFLPEKFDSLFYVPDLTQFYDALKKTNTGDVFINQIGLEQMVLGILEQQLMMQNYTLDDLDLFKELLVASTVDGSAVIAIGPSKDPQKIKEIFEAFSGMQFPSEVLVKDGYFVFSNLPFGGKLPNKVKENIEKGYLAVSYVNTNEDLKVEGYGYARLEGNTFRLYNEIVPKDQETKDFILDLEKQQGKDILSDNKIGGDLFIFLNKKIPKSLLKLLTNVTEEMNVDLNKFLEDFSGTAYISANISDFILNALSGMQQSTVPFYGVVYYSGLNWDDLEGISKFEVINGKKYGVEVTEEGTPVVYVNLESDKMTLYGISPEQYTPGDRTFIEQNYSDDYFFGVLLNLNPTIFNFIGVDTEAYLKIQVYAKDGKIFAKSVLK